MNGHPKCAEIIQNRKVRPQRKKIQKQEKYHTERKENNVQNLTYKPRYAGMDDVLKLEMQTWSCVFYQA